MRGLSCKKESVLTEQSAWDDCTQPESSLRMQQAVSRSFSRHFSISLMILASLRMHGANFAPRCIRSACKIQDINILQELEQTVIITATKKLTHYNRMKHVIEADFNTQKTLMLTKGQRPQNLRAAYICIKKG